MLALADKKRYISIKKLDKELSEAKGIQGNIRELVKSFMLLQGLTSLNEVGLSELDQYRKYISKDVLGLTPTQRKYYLNGMEQAVYANGILSEGVLEKGLNELTCVRAVKNKVGTFLIAQRIHSPEGIDYVQRTIYKEYLEQTIAASKVNEYLKALDQLKINYIKKSGASIIREKNYKDEVLFLLYYPDYEIAKSFYYSQDKEELVFDFTVNAPLTMKKQIYSMILNVLTTKVERHDRRERFLLPLKLFYEYCYKNSIEDINCLTESQKEGFREYIENSSGTKTDIYMQVIDNLRAFLFIQAKETNWNANIWYLDRFELKDGRYNPARPIRSIRFDDIENVTNRDYLKECMKYYIGVSQKNSMQTIRGIYYDIHEFLKFLDKRGICVLEVKADMMNEYIKVLASKDIEPETLNRRVISVYRFYRYMLAKGKIKRTPFNYEYYIKKTQEYHYDREVDLKTQFEILKVLKEFPMHLRLMYLNLWCIGLRLTEVCTLKAGMYSFDGKDAWLKTYQHKMRSEKDVPIPKTLYDLMRKYIEKNGIKNDEYIFQNTYGEAYNAGTFSKQFKRMLSESGITNYSFRAHDFRHTVASFLYKNGASIEVIRDYLGHKESDMTKKYIDYIGEIIDANNEKYFMERGSALAKEVMKGLNADGKEDITN